MRRSAASGKVACASGVDYLHVHFSSSDSLKKRDKTAQTIRHLNNSDISIPMAIPVDLNPV